VDGLISSLTTAARTSFSSGAGVDARGVAKRRGVAGLLTEADSSSAAGGGYTTPPIAGRKLVLADDGLEPTGVAMAERADNGLGLARPPAIVAAAIACAENGGGLLPTNGGRECNGDMALVASPLGDSGPLVGVLRPDGGRGDRILAETPPLPPEDASEKSMGVLLRMVAAACPATTVVLRTETCVVGEKGGNSSRVGDNGVASPVSGAARMGAGISAPPRVRSPRALSAPLPAERMKDAIISQGYTHPTHAS